MYGKTLIILICLFFNAINCQEMLKHAAPVAMGADKSEMALPLNDTACVLSLEKAMTHMCTYQPIAYNRTKKIIGFHFYGRGSQHEKYELADYEKGVLIMFSESFWLYVPGNQRTLDSFHKGYILHKGILYEQPKTFFPRSWTIERVIEYIRHMNQFRVVDTDPQLQNFKNYSITATNENNSVSLRIVVSGCPLIKDDLQIRSIYPLLPKNENGNTEQLANAKALAVRQMQLLSKAPSEKFAEPALIEATIQNNGARVQDLLEHGADPQVVDEHGRTPLMLAAKAGNLTVVNDLLTHNAAKECIDHEGNTALHYAAQSGNYLIALCLADTHLINLPNKKHLTPLMIAVLHKHPEIVHFLASNSATIDVGDSSDRTPLMRACKEVEEPLASVLVEILLRSNASPDVSDTSGDTALTHAIYAHNKAAVKLLVAAHSDFMLPLKHGEKESAYTLAKRHDTAIAHYFDECIAQKIDWMKRNTRYEEQDMRLLYACATKNVALAKKSLDCLIDGTTVSGETALYYATAHNCEELVRLLCTQGANPCVRVEGMSIWEYAQRAEISSDIKTLLREKAEPYLAIEREALQKNRLQLQQFIAQFKKESAAGLLSANTLDQFHTIAHLRNKDYETPLLHEVRRGNHNVVEQILAQSRDGRDNIDAQNNDMLAIAISNNDVRMLEILCMDPHMPTVYIENAIRKAIDHVDCFLAVSTSHEALTAQTIPSDTSNEQNYSRSHIIALLKHMYSFCKDRIVQVVLQSLSSRPSHHAYFLTQNTIIDLQKDAWTVLSAALGNQEFLEYVIRNNPHLVNCCDIHGKTLLMAAAEKNNLECVMFLCSKDADTGRRDNDGQTVYDYCRSNTLSSYLSERQKRMEAEVQLKQCEEIKRKRTEELRSQGWSPLMIAIDANDTAFIEQCETYQMPEGTAARANLLPIHCALSDDRRAVLGILLRRFPNEKNRCDAQGWTPVMHAVHKKSYDATRQLLDHNVDVLHLTSDDKTVFTFVHDDTPRSVVALLEKAYVDQLTLRAAQYALLNEEDVAPRFRKLLDIAAQMKSSQYIRLPEAGMKMLDSFFAHDRADLAQCYFECANLYDTNEPLHTALAKYELFFKKAIERNREKIFAYLSHVTPIVAPHILELCIEHNPHMAAYLLDKKEIYIPDGASFRALLKKIMALKNRRLLASYLAHSIHLIGKLPMMNYAKCIVLILNGPPLKEMIEDGKDCVTTDDEDTHILDSAPRQRNAALVFVIYHGYNIVSGIVKIYITYKVIHFAISFLYSSFNR